MTSIDELSTLRIDLVSALNMQRYHDLLELDNRIREQVQSAMSDINSKSSSAVDREAIKTELFELMSIYREVVERCDSRSNELKKECLDLTVSKKKTDQYLDVAGRR